MCELINPAGCLIKLAIFSLKRGMHSTSLWVQKIKEKGKLICLQQVFKCFCEIGISGSFFFFLFVKGCMTLSFMIITLWKYRVTIDKKPDFWTFERLKLLALENSIDGPCELLCQQKKSKHAPPPFPHNTHEKKYQQW